ncbi:immune inhibitor A [Catenuloplanes nepalensis]|uniref:Immune inhibitor A n=1 Tax=Catenuloplanes nepalensis TaxID=587533 RepID=A0ABT9MSE6_9ACTN|nr:immune inhibitor A domain-containing protein [Catenuloplanes nepalensis]MDP9794340.1 immune inhibitor A [Catenuloplanes nepalensis]
MHGHIRTVLVGVTAAAFVLVVPGSPAIAAPPAMDSEPRTPVKADNLEHPLGESREAAREEALTKLLNGEVTSQQRNGSEVVRLGGDRWVEVRQKTKTDPVLTFLVEFGTQTLPQTGGTPGPLHNQLPAPDRANDNTTLWVPDFSPAYYQELLFSTKKESMTTFYTAQSGGRYTVTGEVGDWVQVPYNEARYGSNTWEGGTGYQDFVKDSATAWYQAQVAAGQTPAQITASLAKYDVWDRYDFDTDGDFNEPDGYIDHFQAIHAGEGEEAGGGAQGADAIWSHRGYTYQGDYGQTGPEHNRLGGVPIGDSGLWIGDYTTEPENGGLGVFAHEYGHDLGLPDLYDTQGGDNSTGFWSLMSAGSWLSHDPQNIGSTPGYMGAWEKLFLGWLDYTTVKPGQKKTVVLGQAADAKGPLPQAVIVPLPDQTVVREYNTPYSGEYEWWGGDANDLNTMLTRTLDLTAATTASLTTKAWYEIEAGYDYLYAEVSADGGNRWTRLGTPLTGSSEGEWVDLTYDLSAFAGQAVQFRFRYQTDGGVHFAGAFLDDITLVVNGAPVWTDDVESATTAWTARGFTRFTGTLTRVAPRYYIAEWRTYTGYDKVLKTGPYNYGWANTRPDWVEKFPYQDGLLVWYVNDAFTDNDTINHPGGGAVLPVDARPEPIVFPDGVRLGNRRQPFDATFGVQRTDAVTFHRNGVPVTVPARPPVTTFDDSDPNRYYSAANPQGSVQVAGLGVKIQVLTEWSLIAPFTILTITSPRQP